MPPLIESPERIPVTEAHRNGVSDPMTASLIRVPGNGDLMRPEACQQAISVFDGRMRYDLKLVYKRMDKVRADKGYDGPGRGLRGAVHADLRLRAVAPGDQISDPAARHRSVAGADRGDPRGGAVPSRSCRRRWAWA